MAIKRQVTSAQSIKRPVSAESGFGIIESMVALAAILIVGTILNTVFVGSADVLVYRKSRLLFEEKLLQLMVVTEENNVCEHLNIVQGGFFAKSAPGDVIATLNNINVDGQNLIEVGRKGLFEIKKIEVIQDSITFGVNPVRARAKIVVTAEFFESKDKTKPVARVPLDQKTGGVVIMVAMDGSNRINSCYGTFSRRISCIDANGVYNPEKKPNCSL
jgi:type II secretory pathway pseudopilin PulG